MRPLPCVATPAGDVGPAQVHEVGAEDAARDLAHLGQEDGGAEAEHEQEERPRRHDHPPSKHSQHWIINLNLIRIINSPDSIEQI